MFHDINNFLWCWVWTASSSFILNNGSNIQQNTSQKYNQRERQGKGWRCGSQDNQWVEEDKITSLTKSSKVSIKYTSYAGCSVVSSAQLSSALKRLIICVSLWWARIVWRWRWHSIQMSGLMESIVEFDNQLKISKWFLLTLVQRTTII